MSKALTPVGAYEDIFSEWRGTPIADLIAYHNLGRPHRTHVQAELLIIMCMDYRNTLRIPDNFAYILRTGGGNPSRIEFEISFAIAVKGIRALALIAHDDCGMVGLSGRCDIFEQGLVEVGWAREEARAHFDMHARSLEIPDPVEFACVQARRMQACYLNTAVAPLFYSVKEGLLCQI